MRRRAKVLVVAALLVSAMALGGCAPDPDVSSLASELEEIPGVNGAVASVAHSGAPWNTDIVVTLFVDEPTVDGVAEIVREGTPVFLADSSTAERGVEIFVTDADPTEYDETAASPDYFTSMRAVAEELGIDSRGNSLLSVSGDDLDTLAAAR